ncbi:uncharacterized protein C12orf60 homolog [Carettochelys insculpta]|uniref:uncharacterized protein C12orf60 homolog n=1 Tax=Carettochelys insculpta TaxID=44489 RepID=UPI003EBCA22C
MLSLFGAERDKQRVLTASQTLYDFIYIYVSSTNTIFRILNQHLGTNFPIITVRENLSIKENLQLLISTLKEMQVVVEMKDKVVQNSISQCLYAKLAGPITSLQEKLTVVKDLYENYKGVLGSIIGPIAAVLLKHGNLPESVESAIRHLATSPALSLRVADLLMSHDEIAKILPITPENSPSGSRTEEARPHRISTAFSFASFLQHVLWGQASTNILKIAADYLEEAVRVLRPSCESFQCIVKLAEVYVSLVTDKLQ